MSEESEKSEAKAVEEVKASASKWKSPAARRAEAAAAQEAPIDEGKLKEMHKMIRQVLNRVSEQNLTDMFNKLTAAVNWEGMRKKEERTLFTQGYSDIYFLMTGPN
jgi:hypothetical protein